MGKQMTEMLKGALEGIVLALLAEQPAYGYEITARLRDHGFTDIAEGTIYALLVRVEQKRLVDVEKVPSEKGPPRKVFTLNAAGRRDLEGFWTTWSFLSEHIESLRRDGSDISADTAPAAKTNTNTNTEEN
ncbi:PadR family transcriptional regulator [Microbacterium foliorum]|uniref:PadR family transcriptional regulator n=1 Tax=Microbacterium foliorum TaxID=104336 RepID=UPI0028D7CCB7|nr:PadR family transcriptional regulator [Microbacterium foliorum]